MQVAFPYPVKLQAVTPVLEGLRYSTFTNIDGEPFAAPALNGFWRVSMSVVAHDMQSRLALSSFITQMSGAGVSCVIPICTQYRPNNANGRRLSAGCISPQWTMDHVGFEAEPFDGFRLREAASYRDSYIDVDKPALSELWPGMFISLGDRLHQVVNVNYIEDSETAVRVSLMPNLRAAYPAGEIVIVDQLRLKVVLESGDQIGVNTNPFKSSSLEFVEAFG